MRSLQFYPVALSVQINRKFSLNELTELPCNLSLCLMVSPCDVTMGKFRCYATGHVICHNKMWQKNDAFNCDPLQALQESAKNGDHSVTCKNSCILKYDVKNTPCFQCTFSRTLARYIYLSQTKVKDANVIVFPHRFFQIGPSD